MRCCHRNDLLEENEDHRRSGDGIDIVGSGNLWLVAVE